MSGGESKGESKQMTDQEFKTAYGNFSNYFDFLKDVFLRRFNSKRTKFSAGFKTGMRYLPLADFRSSLADLEIVMRDKEAYERAEKELCTWSDAKKERKTRKEWLLAENGKQKKINELKKQFDNKVRRYHLSFDFNSYDYKDTYKLIWFKPRVKFDKSKLEDLARDSFSDWIGYEIIGDEVVITKKSKVGSKSLKFTTKLKALEFIWKMVGALTHCVYNYTKDRDVHKEFENAKEEFARMWEDMLKRRNTRLRF